MAKKFVRGVTGIEDIESYDKTLTNVNDILSDGQDTYVHTKKGKNESYYKLTDGVKQVKSTDSMLTISKDDTGTVSIANSGLATKQQLSAKQDALTVGDGLSLSNNKIEIKPTDNTNPLNVDGFYKGIVAGDNLSSSIISLTTQNGKNVQLRFRESGVSQGKMIMWYRFVNNGEATDWKLATIDKDTIDQQIAQKQNTLASNTSIGVLSNNQLQQLFSQKQTYTHANGLLKTHVKNVAENTTINTNIEEFNFTVKINQNATNIVVTLNAHDTSAFNKIMTKYGSNNTVRISGCVFTLSGSSLTVSTTNNTAQNYVITFSDILD